MRKRGGVVESLKIEREGEGKRNGEEDANVFESREVTTCETP